MQHQFMNRFARLEFIKPLLNWLEKQKLVENSFRDVNVAFANEVSMPASEYDVDYTDVIGFVNMHPRVNVLSPGVGVEGTAFLSTPGFLFTKN